MNHDTLSAFRASLHGVVPEDTIEELSHIIPDHESDSEVAMAVAGIVKALPRELSSKQVVEAVISRLSFMQREHQQRRGQSPGNSQTLTRSYYDNLLIEMRLIGAEEPSTKVELFGEVFASPIMTAALSHLSAYRKDEYGQMEFLAQGAKAAGCLHWVGMIENDHFAQIMETGAKVIRIVKPYADEEKIICQLRQAEALGAVAVGMDIDHAVTAYGDEDIVQGERMERKTLMQMQTYVQATKLPFIVKGVLSVHDTLVSKELGAKGVLLSHHGGRMAFAVPPPMLLPDIRRAVGNELNIFVDCGIASGMDAYKALALGADAVGVGTHLISYVRTGGADAVKNRLLEMTAELKGVMSFTGIKNCIKFDPAIIHRVQIRVD